MAAAARKKFALVYDFDGTLLEGNSMDYHLLPDLGFQGKEIMQFWQECNNEADRISADRICVYMRKLMQMSARQGILLNQTQQQAYGALLDEKLLAGLTGPDNWFDRINQYCAKAGLEPLHYIVSSGLQQIIEGCGIRHHFKAIYACDYMYDDHGVPTWPARTINYTLKTQFLFRINKGVLDPTDDEGLNQYTEPSQRPIPFSNMVFIGDGYTDIPCFSLLREKGGHALAVLKNKNDTRQFNKLINQNRVHAVSLGDHFLAQGALETEVFKIVGKISAPLQ